MILRLFNGRDYMSLKEKMIIVVGISSCGLAEGTILYSCTEMWKIPPPPNLRKAGLYSVKFTLIM
jgi:hypothetical protein